MGSETTGRSGDRAAVQGWQTDSSRTNNQQDEKNNCIRFTIHKIYKGLGWSWQTRSWPPDLGRASGSACLTGETRTPVCWGPSGRLGADVPASA